MEHSEFSWEEYEKTLIALRELQCNCSEREGSIYPEDHESTCQYRLEFNAIFSCDNSLFTP